MLVTQSLPDTVAAEVRAEAARQGIRHRVIAERLGLSQAQVSERMRGGIEFRLSELEQIADLLGVRVQDLMRAPERAA